MSSLSTKILHRISSPGFTLVETLVALTILTVALIPAFNQATTAVALSSSIRNSLIASNLAQEGLEVVRAIRDANWFSGQPFDTGLISGGGGVPCDIGGCLVQYDSVVPRDLSGNPPLKLDPVTGLYQYTTGTDTAFRRKITITEISAHELQVISEITWSERSGVKTYSVEYHLYDWLK